MKAKFSLSSAGVQNKPERATPGPDVHLGGPPARGEKTLPRSRQMVRLNRAAHYCQMAASWDHPVADRNKAIAISPARAAGVRKANYDCGCFFYLSLSTSINFLALLVSRMGLDKGELLLANTAELTD
ncbi:hypothetical protein M514_13678 [Trichuris suis]|uniref:Uncharacterized protein n=1 Tax=Trichuris suis TaxID=68888 RepID=A0A085MSP6_9BILA|nr:hypothetical protein M514_13678 [Trichuris suis]